MDFDEIVTRILLVVCTVAMILGTCALGWIVLQMFSGAM